MTPNDPKFMKSKFFVDEPQWHLKEGASEEDKRELEEWMNTGNYQLVIDYPKMKNPYYTWSGKVVDKG